MRYTVIYFDSFEMKVLADITDELIQACRKGLLSIIDMEAHLELTAKGKWVPMYA